MRNSLAQLERHERTAQLCLWVVSFTTYHAQRRMEGGGEGETAGSAWGKLWTVECSNTAVTKGHMQEAMQVDI